MVISTLKWVQTAQRLWVVQNTTFRGGVATSLHAIANWMVLSGRISWSYLDLSASRRHSPRTHKSSACSSAWSIYNQTLLISHQHREACRIHLESSITPLELLGIHLSSDLTRLLLKKVCNVTSVSLQDPSRFPRNLTLYQSERLNLPLLEDQSKIALQNEWWRKQRRKGGLSPERQPSSNRHPAIQVYLSGASPCYLRLISVPWLSRNWVSFGLCRQGQTSLACSGFICWILQIRDIRWLSPYRTKCLLYVILRICSSERMLNPDIGEGSSTPCSRSRSSPDPYRSCLGLARITYR